MVDRAAQGLGELGSALKAGVQHGAAKGGEALEAGKKVASDVGKKIGEAVDMGKNVAKAVVSDPTVRSVANAGKELLTSDPQHKSVEDSVKSTGHVAGLTKDIAHEAATGAYSSKTDKAIRQEMKESYESNYPVVPEGVKEYVAERSKGASKADAAKGAVVAGLEHAPLHESFGHFEKSGEAIAKGDVKTAATEGLKGVQTGGTEIVQTYAKVDGIVGGAAEVSKLGGPEAGAPETTDLGTTQPDLGDTMPGESDLGTTQPDLGDTMPGETDLGTTRPDLGDTMPGETDLGTTQPDLGDTMPGETDPGKSQAGHDNPQRAAAKSPLAETQPPQGGGKGNTVRMEPDGRTSEAPQRTPADSPMAKSQPPQGGGKGNTVRMEPDGRTSEGPQRTPADSPMAKFQPPEGGKGNTVRMEPSAAAPAAPKEASGAPRGSSEQPRVGHGGESAQDLRPSAEDLVRDVLPDPEFQAATAELKQIEGTNKGAIEDGDPRARALDVKIGKHEKARVEIALRMGALERDGKAFEGGKPTKEYSALLEGQRKAAGQPREAYEQAFANAGLKVPEEPKPLAGNAPRQSGTGGGEVANASGEAEKAGPTAADGVLPDAELDRLIDESDRLQRDNEAFDADDNMTPEYRVVREQLDRHISAKFETRDGRTGPNGPDRPFLGDPKDPKKKK